MAKNERFRLPKNFSLLSAQVSPIHDEGRHGDLLNKLRESGFEPIKTKGHWFENNGQLYDEKSYLVPHDGSEESKNKIQNLAFKDFGQKALIHSSERNHSEIHSNGKTRSGRGLAFGKNLPKPHTEVEGTPYKFHLIFHGDLQKSVKGFDGDGLSIDPHGQYQKSVKHLADSIVESTKPHYYGRIDGVHVFHAVHDSHRHLAGEHVTDPTEESLSHSKEMAQVHPSMSLVIHGTPPASLRHKAPPAKHAHGYDWHDGHTQHHELKKTDLEANPGNAQAAGAGVKTYAPIAKHYGTITPGQKTNLKFYPNLHKIEPKVDEIVKNNGYTHYFAGGKYGKPDLANKNYNTKHLMIYDPTSGSGGDFGETAYTGSWRKLHELAHALTYPELNKMYGEGRRLGKLGPRTHREAARAVHWEWLAAHKQRELAEQAGVKIPDADFHRELNTVMHDAVHRAIHGTFTEPSDEGFYPTDAKIPLEFALKQVSDAAKAKGIHDPTVEPPPEPGVQDYPKLNKAFLHNDGQSQTNAQTLATNAASLPQNAIKWGKEFLAGMKKDQIKHVPLPEKALLKVRKVLEGLYSGWIEKNGMIIHSFERLTMPELINQIRAKLDLYDEDDLVPSKAVVLKKLKNIQNDTDNQNVKTLIDQIKMRLDYADEDRKTMKQLIEAVRSEIGLLKELRTK